MKVAGHDQAHPSERHQHVPRFVHWSGLQQLAATLGSSIVIVAFATVVYAGLSRQAEDQELLASTHRAIGAIDRVLAQMTEAETGQRGFLLTARERYLDPYRRARRQTRLELDTLRQLTAGDPVQAARADTLAALAEDRLAEIDSTLALERAGHRGAALALIESDLGARIMDRAREVAADMEQTETALLAARATREAHLASLVQTVLGAGTLLTIAVALLINTLFTRHAAAQERSAAELTTQAEELWRTNAALEQAATALRISEEQLRLVLGASRLGPWEWDIPSGRVNWSAPVEAMHGIPRGTFPGTFEAFLNDVLPADRDRVLLAIRSAVEQRTSYYLRYRITRHDGEVRWLEAYGALILDARGTPERLVGVCADITERQRGEDDLRFIARASEVLASSLDYPATLSTVACLAVPTLADWCFVDLLADDGTLERLVIAHEDEGKVALATALDARYPDNPASPVGRYHVLRTGTPEFLFEIPDKLLVGTAQDAEHLRILRSFGMRSYMVVPLAIHGDVLGAMTFISAESGRRYEQPDVALAEDLARRAAMAIDNSRLIAEITKSREAAEAANEAKSQFLAMMSHELRTPLNAIGGYTDLLTMELRGPLTEAQRVDLGRIKKSGQHLLAIINDILNLARIEAGRLDLHLTNVPLAAALDDVEALITPQMQAKGLTFTSAHPDTELAARADAEKLQQILLNLLSNAVKFTPSGGRVTVQCDLVPAGESPHGDAAGQSQIVIQVQDTGRGISADKLATIFEPFVQIDRRGTVESQQGVGLGLAISRDLARAMDGELSVVSTFGAGSTFTLTLPAVVGDMGAVPHAGSEASDSHDARVASLGSDSLLAAS
jgi:PAS domain S-box-containing protein